MTATQERTARLFPPLDATPDRDLMLRHSTHAGRPDPDDPTDVVAIWGHCMDFCSLGGPTNGQQVGEEHPAYCSSPSVTTAGIQAVDFAGETVDVFLDLVGDYHHGVYHRSAVYGRHQRFARLGLLGNGFEPDEQDGDIKGLHLTSSHARSLAAALTRAADTLDRLTIDHSGNRAERDRQG